MHHHTQMVLSFKITMGYPEMPQYTGAGALQHSLKLNHKPMREEARVEIKKEVDCRIKARKQKLE